MAKDLLVGIRNGQDFTLRQQIELTLRLSFPAILAQLSSTLMQYIDAAMVGALGADASAAVGLVSTSTWLFHGLCFAAVLGFTVQVAQRLGAKDDAAARSLLRQSLVVCMALVAVLTVIGVLIAPSLPAWLRADRSIHADAAAYFRIIALGMPALTLMDLSSGMLQASGNMKTPSVFMILSCFLDVVYNFFLIFPTREVWGFTVPGAGMGVAGAALGTVLAHATAAVFLLFALLCRSPSLHLRKGEHLRFSAQHLRTWVRLMVPLALERSLMSGASVVSTAIIAPMGNISVAAHSFALTVEALCYMPSYGVQRAATALVGQSVGARRRDLAIRFGYVTTVTGMIVMGTAAAIVYVTCPWILSLLTPEAEVIVLATAVLRIVAFVEPFYAAGCVSMGVMQSAGSTLISTVMNFGSLWLVRLPLSFLLAGSLGLRGMWIAMSIELVFRGSIYLLMLRSKRWLPPELRHAPEKNDQTTT